MSTGYSQVSRSLLFFLPHALDPEAGGVQRITWTVGHNLASRGWKIVFCSLSYSGHTEPYLGVLSKPSRPLADKPRAIRQYLLSVVTEYKPSVIVNMVGLEPQPQKALRKLSGEYGFKLVSCFLNNPAFYRDNFRRLLSFRLRRVPVVRGLVRSGIFDFPLLFLHRISAARLFNYAVRSSDKFVMLSPTFMEELRWYLPNVDQSKLAAIPPPLPAVSAGHITSKEKKILFVARIEQAQKNVFALPEIWCRVQESLPDWELHVVGDGRDRPRLSELFTERACRRVYLHGKRDPFPFYEASQIFLMTSYYEGFGVTLIEAQMCGVVPVGFDSYSAISWILNKNKDAILVCPFDVDRFAQEVIKLAQDESTWKAMSAAARLNAKRFNVNEVCEQWNDLLVELVEKASEESVA